MTQRATFLGYALKGNALAQVFVAFKRRADEIGLIDDKQLIDIIEAVLADARVEHLGGANAVA